MPTTLEEAGALQEALASSVVIEPLAWPPHVIGAVDAAYADGRTYAAAVVCRFDSLALLGERVVLRDTSFPYLPGYFWLREAPALLDAVRHSSGAPTYCWLTGRESRINEILVSPAISAS